MERFNLKKLNKVKGKEQLLAAVEDLDIEEDINSAWERIRENIKISAKESVGYCEMKKHPRIHVK
jgi:hypothetical protein